MDVVFLHNPKAGGSETPAGEFERKLREAGYRPQTHDLHEALRSPAVLGGGDFVIVAGGDGSVRKAALALLDHPRPLAILPVGTANNIARSLGQLGDPAEVIRGWNCGRDRRRFDVGVASGPWGQRPFLEGLGLGLVSRAMAALALIDQASDRRFGSREEKLHRDLCVFAALAHELAPRVVTLAADGERRTGRYLLVEVLNIARAGPGVEFAGPADPCDGRLDLAVVEADERERLVDAVLQQLAGRNGGQSIGSKPVRQLTLEVEDTELRIDDETVSVGAPAVIEITLRAGALELIRSEIR